MREELSVIIIIPHELSEIKMDNNVLRGWAKRRISRKNLGGKCPRVYVARAFIFLAHISIRV